MNSYAVDSETGEITPVDDGTNALVAYREHLKNLTPEDPAEIQERILRAILEAGSAEDVINAGAALAMDKVLDLPLTVERIRAGESTFADGPDYYLLVDATIKSNGDKVTFSTGASDVVMKLTALDMKGFLPCDVKLVRSTKPTAKGFYPVFLKPIEDAF